MKRRRTRGYKGYRGRSRLPKGILPVLLAVMVLALAGTAAYFFSPWRPWEAAPQPAEQDNVDKTTPADEDPVTPPEDPAENDPPKDETPSTGYAVIRLEGEKKAYDTVFRVGDTGFEMYTYVPEQAQKYAEAVNKTAETLKDVSTVYDITVPLSSSITLPDDMQGDPLFDDQKAAMETVAGMMGEKVHTVSLYEALMQHRGEYIYYRTDHHWTALGAYYAYCQFCQAKGITPHALTDYEKVEFPGFLGSFYRDTNQDKTMEQHPDTVEAYRPVSKDAELTFTDSQGQTYPWDIIFDVTDYPADLKYSCFIASDNPYTVIRNPALTDGSTCLVVKESFGNAFVPYLVDHYQTIHVVDYRYWEGNLTSFAKANGVQDVIFINNLSAIRSSYLMGKLQGVM